MNGGMQCLDSAVHDFGKAGDVRDVLHFDPAVSQRIGRTSRRNNFDAQASKRLRKIEQAGFVGNREERTGHRPQGKIRCGHAVVLSQWAWPAEPLICCG